MERTIKVTGKGKISVFPDRIRLNLSCDGIRQDYSEAIAKSAEDTRYLQAAVEKAGLNPKDLRTQHFDVNTEYESYQDERGNWKQRFAGYRYRHSLFIQFANDNALLSQVLYALSRCPAAVEFSIGYTVSDPESVKNALLAEAVEDSKEKARVLAAAAGVILGEIKAIDYSWEQLEIYAQPMRKMAAAAYADEEEAAFDMDIQAADIDVSDTVTIVWGIDG